MKFVIVLLLTVLCSCDNSAEKSDNSRPFPENLSIGLQFIDKKGNDASNNVSMSFDKTIENVDFFKIADDNYSMQCYINGELIPKTYYLGDIHDKMLMSDMYIEATKRKSDIRKTIWFKLSTFYGIEDWSSDDVYELEYVFNFPTLVQGSANRIKAKIKAKDLGSTSFINVKFNGKDIDKDGNVYVCKITKL